MRGMRVLFSGTEKEREKPRGKYCEEGSSVSSDFGPQRARAWAGCEGRQQSR